MITAFAGHTKSIELGDRITSSRLIGLLFVQGASLRVDHFLAIAVAVASVTNEMCNKLKLIERQKWRAQNHEAIAA
jgi:hypothetical protein